MGCCMEPRLLFAAGWHGMWPRPRSIHQHINRDLLGCDSGRGCQSGSPPAVQCATTTLSILSASPGGRMSPCPTAEGELAKDWENTPVRWESLHTQAGWGEMGFRKRPFAKEGVECAVGVRCSCTPVASNSAFICRSEKYLNL